MDCLSEDEGSSSLFFGLFLLFVLAIDFVDRSLLIVFVMDFCCESLFLGLFLVFPIYFQSGYFYFYVFVR